MRYKEIMSLLDKFDDDAPFTIQRLAEVLTLPVTNKQFASTHKLINSMERLLSVSSTVSVHRREDLESNIIEQLVDHISAPSLDPSSPLLQAAKVETVVSSGSGEKATTIILDDI
jgi:PPP4R2